MIKVLVVDDNVNKINDIVAEIRKSYGESQVSIETAIFANDAKRILKRNSIDKGRRHKIVKANKRRCRIHISAVCNSTFCV